MLTVPVAAMMTRESTKFATSLVEVIMDEWELEIADGLLGSFDLHVAVFTLLLLYRFSAEPVLLWSLKTPCLLLVARV